MEVCTGEKGNESQQEQDRTVQLQGADVVKVNEFKYLGSVAQSNGECGREVKNSAGRVEWVEKSARSDL